MEPSAVLLTEQLSRAGCRCAECATASAEWSDAGRGAVVRGANNLGPGLADRFGSLPYEALFCLPIDDGGTVLGCVLIAWGGRNMVSATRKEVLRAAIAHGATRLVLAHNHPSGHTAPSSEDRAFTRGLLDAAELVGLEVLDHLIFGPGRWVSLRETTDLWA